MGNLHGINDAIKVTLFDKGSGVWRGVKEKQVLIADKSAEGKNHVNVAKDVVSPSVIDEPVLKEKQSSLVNTSILNVEAICLRSCPPLPMQGSTPADNTPGMSSYANVTSAPIITKYLVNISKRRAFWSLNEDILKITILTTNTSYPSRKIRHIRACTHERPQRKQAQYIISKEDQYAVLDIWHVNILEDIKRGPYSKKLQYAGMSSYARAMIELRPDVELIDTIVVAMPKITGEGFYTYNICVEIGSGEAKNLKKPSQTPRGVPVGLKVGFKPTKAYRLVFKNPTTNTSSNKMKGVEPTKEVSNSNPFDVLNSVVNDVELGTNVGTLNLASNEANSSGSSFWNVKTSSTYTTSIVDKIRKLEKLIIDEKVTLVDDDGQPLKKVDYSGDHDSEDEVESVDNDMARSMALERVGFGTKSLLE
ncbi:hypothetical protein Tco_0934027 [Tanacetum coccineum]